MKPFNIFCILLSAAYGVGIAGPAHAGEESGLGETQVFYELKELPDRVLMPGYRMLDCNLEEAVPAAGAQMVNLEPGVFLYLVPCTNADLNFPYYAALEIAGEIDTVEFQQPASETGERVSLITNPSWDKGLNKLTSYQYFSPDQDCGQYETHNFDAAERQFYLSEYRKKDTCDGVVSEPGQYPMEWNGEGN